ncbi:MAG TPA: ExeM/NucH family extracellular endonuclease [Cytophagaceae bacterium]|jgi:hypothetical protein
MMCKLILTSIAISVVLSSSLCYAQTSLRIFEIQGADSVSPHINKIVTTSGVVTASYNGKNQLKGYFIQDTVGDGNENTSDGMFIFDDNKNTSIALGDFIKVTGTVKEYFKLTELAELTSIRTLSTKNHPIKPVEVALPLKKEAWEKFEGMLVHFKQKLTVTDNFYLGQYGELSLSAASRLYVPTEIVDPNDEFAQNTSFEGTSNIAAIIEQESRNNSNYVILNDGSTQPNPPVVPYLSKENSLRVGSKVLDLLGVVNFANNEYKIEPIDTPDFIYSDRPEVPSLGASSLKVASMNVLNYFNGNGTGGGFPTSRGAATLKEFERQRAKIVNAIKAIDADIIGLMEIENDGDGPLSAIQDLVNAVNEASGKVVYKQIADPRGARGNAGTDAIKVAIIYKPTSVTPIELSLSDTNVIHNRPPLSQTFVDNQSGVLSIIVNHFKSKGCSGAKGLDTDQKDGQSCFNAQRKAQASTLLKFIHRVQDASQDKDVLLIGDFNSYSEEDPLDLLRSEGMTSIIKNDYSYVFARQSGSLDHALVTPTLLPQVRGSAKWHVNADEPRVLDYGMKTNPSYLSSDAPYRFSDHDPVILGLSLAQDNLSNRDNSNGQYFNITQYDGSLKYRTLQEGTLELIIFDSRGKAVGQHNQYVGVGEGNLTIDSSIIQRPGLYLYKSIFKNSSGSVLSAGKFMQGE